MSGKPAAWPDVMAEALDAASALRTAAEGVRVGGSMKAYRAAGVRVSRAISAIGQAMRTARHHQEVFDVLGVLYSALANGIEALHAREEKGRRPLR